MKNFFSPKVFTPNACKKLAKFIRSEGNCTFKMFLSNNSVEYQVDGFRIFLPSSILNKGYHFSRIPEDAAKKLVLHFTLSEEDLVRLVEMLGGSIKKISSSHSLPKLGDLLK